MHKLNTLKAFFIYFKGGKKWTIDDAVKNERRKKLKSIQRVLKSMV